MLDAWYGCLMFNIVILYCLGSLVTIACNLLLILRRLSSNGRSERNVLSGSSHNSGQPLPRPQFDHIKDSNKNRNCFSMAGEFHNNITEEMEEMTSIECRVEVRMEKNWTVIAKGPTIWMYCLPERNIFKCRIKTVREIDDLPRLCMMEGFELAMRASCATCHC